MKRARVRIGDAMADIEIDGELVPLDRFPKLRWRIERSIPPLGGGEFDYVLDVVLVTDMDGVDGDGDLPAIAVERRGILMPLPTVLQIRSFQ